MVSDDPESPTIDERKGRASDARLTGLTDYVFGEVIGAGGMGEVVQARDTRIGRDVAIKRMRDESPSPERVERFLREAKIQARLDHPAIVPVYELGFDAEGRPYFVMKRLAGVTLRSVMDGGTESLQRQLRALVEVCNAIELAHARGVVHRDLKPSNIMLGDYGEVYVIDWGVARVLGTRDSAPVIQDLDASDATLAGQMLGTPGYMAPEQITGDEVGPPADVYALGAILFEILTGERLHPGRGAALISTMESTASSPSLRRPERGIAPELEAACCATLAKDPAERSTVRELRDRIQLYLDGDRDIEQRRALASELATRAETAERVDALRLAGRALALDPACDPAVKILASWLFEPPREIPPEVRVELHDGEVMAARLRSRRAVAPFSVMAMICIVSMAFGIDHAWRFGGLMLSIALVMTFAVVNWRVRPVPTWMFFLVQLVMVVMFEQIAGPFVLTPVLAIGMLLSLTSHSGLIDRAWLVMAWVLLAIGIPLLLEWLGVFETTWWITDRGLLSRGGIYATNSTGLWTIVIANALAVLLMAGYVLSISRDRRAAKARVHLQAWQLRQVLPG